MLAIAGDSFLCLWPASPGSPLATAVARAAAAAQGMLKRTTGCAAIGLPVRIAP